MEVEEVKEIEEVNKVEERIAETERGVPGLSSSDGLGIGRAEGVYPTPVFVRVANAGLIFSRVKRVSKE